MANDAFVAFWAGACCGLVFGVMFTAVFAATAMRTERTEKTDIIEEELDKYINNRRSDNV